MKKWTTLWIMIMMLGVSVPALGAMSISKMRQNTFRFSVSSLPESGIFLPSHLRAKQ